jgi:hypothetical protein
VVPVVLPLQLLLCLLGTTPVVLPLLLCLVGTTPLQAAQ